MGPTAPVLVSESESESEVKVKFKINKCAKFSSFLILQKKCGKKSDSSLKIRKTFTKDFHVKKKSHGNSLEIESISKFKGISFIKILQEVRSIYNKGIPY